MNTNNKQPQTAAHGQNDALIDRLMESRAKLLEMREGDAYAFSKLAEAHDKLLAQRDEEQKAKLEWAKRAQAIAAQRDELLAALHSVSHDIADAMLWIKSKTESDARKFQGVTDMLNRSRKQRIAAIAKAEQQ